MGALVVMLIVIAVVGVGAGVAYAVALALRSKREYEASNEVVPGRPSSVPASWAGSHDDAAVLHRRLVAAMAALRANRSFDDEGALIDLRVELEQQALAIDDRLVAVDALPAPVRAEALGEATAATAAVEQAVATVTAQSVAAMGPAVEAALDDLRRSTSTLDEIRRQLDASDPSVDPAVPSSPDVNSSPTPTSAPPPMPTSPTPPPTPAVRPDPSAGQSPDQSLPG
ncbi:MAG: hypothetical protein ACR2LA_09780 [Acidimicrobiales bacterium]